MKKTFLLGENDLLNNEQFEETDITEDKLDQKTLPITEEKTKSMIGKDSKKCQDCSIVFLTSFRLQRHIKKFHGGVTPTMANSDTPIGMVVQGTEFLDYKFHSVLVFSL